MKLEDYLYVNKCGFPGGSAVKNLPANAGDTGDVGSVHGSGGVPEEGNGNPLQCSCLENPTNREAWQATVHRVTESDTMECACNSPN